MAVASRGLYETLADVERGCRALASEPGLALRFHQSNHKCGAFRHYSFVSGRADEG